MNRCCLTRIVPGLLATLMAAASVRAQVVNADECPNATSIAGTGTFAYDTRNASRSTSPGFFAGSVTMNYDVWARWTAPQTGWLILSTCANGTTSGVVTIYQGGDCAALLPLAVGNWNICGSRIAEFWVDQGQTYTFRLDLPRRLGAFSLAYGTAFPGDECQNAIQIAGTGVFPFDNSGAHGQYIAADPYQYVTNDVWYRWTAPTTGHTYINTCGVMLFGAAAVQLFAEDAGCPVVGDDIAFNSDAPGCIGVRIDFQATAGQNYLIRLGSTNSAARISNGAFEIVQPDSPPGGGETITVTTAYDRVDFTGAQNVASLPGPDGLISFREACIAANNTPGPQTIAFSVPESQWYYPRTTFPYAALINASGVAFVLTDHETFIDGTTQTTNVGDTNPNGPDVGFWNWNPNAAGAPNVIITGNNCTVTGMLGAGMIGYSYWINGDDNHIFGCQLTSSLVAGIAVRGDRNLVGGVEPGEFNTVDGLIVEGQAHDTVVVGNRILGLTVRQGAANTRIGGPTDAERNIIGGAGGYCCEGLPQGSQIGVGDGATGTRLLNNYIGVQADGVTRINQVGPVGISISGATGTEVRGNIVSECFAIGQNHYAGELFGVGIRITGASDNTVIQGNLIGTDASGNAPITNLVGISVAPAGIPAVYPTNTIIGGEQPGQGNLIAFSNRTGLYVSDGVTGVPILGNRFRSNGLLGIDLGPDTGVTLNDAGDADTGGNNLQNFPVLADASVRDGVTTVRGTLNSSAGADFRIELFASAACDPSGHGEGEVFLGAGPVTTDAAGNAAFVTDVAAAPIGWVVTATATRASTGDTSEFSACIPVTSGPECPADFNNDGALNSQDFFDFLAAFFNGNADFNADGLTNSQDFFDFLTAFFEGC